MDPFFLQLAVLFIPGMIWERVDAMFIQNGRPDQFEILRRTFIFGLISYLATYAAFQLAGFEFLFVELVKDQQIITPSLARQILAASLMSVLLSIVYVFAMDRAVVHRFFRLIRVSKRFGETDVWDHMLNQRIPDVEYVHFRDWDKKIVYAGWVDYFSDSGKVREVVLRDVQVFDFEGAPVYEAPRIYVARAIDKIDMEFPYRETTGAKR